MFLCFLCIIGFPGILHRCRNSAAPSRASYALHGLAKQGRHECLYMSSASTTSQIENMSKCCCNRYTHHTAPPVVAQRAAASFSHMHVSGSARCAGSPQRMYSGRQPNAQITLAMLHHVFQRIPSPQNFSKKLTVRSGTAAPVLMSTTGSHN